MTPDHAWGDEREQARVNTALAGGGVSVVGAVQCSGWCAVLDGVKCCVMRPIQHWSVFAVVREL